MKTFRCRVRSAGRTIIIECVAPTATAAAWAVGCRALEDNAAWVQVVVSEWSGVLGEYLEPENAHIISAGQPPPPGVEDVVFASTTAEPSPSR